LGAGLRLRARVNALAPPNCHGAEAILKPGGKVLDARGPAATRSARERLRQAVMQSEHARGPLLRQDPVQALSLWEALVEGRWSLVDSFDSDGGRLVVALENVPGMRDPRGLTATQRHIGEALGKGHRAKAISYDLGVSVSAVNNAVDEIKHKLGLRSRTDVAAFFAPAGLRARLAKLELGDMSLLVGNYGDFDPDALTLLTDAERAVALLLLQGATNSAIARCRSCAYRTVANQTRAIYSKLGVTNRAQLAALLSASVVDGQARHVPIATQPVLSASHLGGESSIALAAGPLQKNVAAAACPVD
jgi:DNA-binding NarL/FixJ family response regulator